MRFLDACEACYDIVFVDPPYDEPNLLLHSLASIAARRLVRRFVYVESRSLESLHAATENEYEWLRQSRAGDAHGALLSLRGN